jgi:hypothetical protein
MRHRSSKDLWVHLRDLESILLPLRVECIDSLSGHIAKSGSSSSVHAKKSRPLPQHRSHEGWDKVACRPHLPIDDLHCAGEHHAPWPRNTVNLVL